MYALPHLSELYHIREGLILSIAQSVASKLCFGVDAYRPGSENRGHKNHIYWVKPFANWY
jgi:hypothetical protein